MAISLLWKKPSGLTDDPRRGIPFCTAVLQASLLVNPALGPALSLLASMDYLRVGSSKRHRVPTLPWSFSSDSCCMSGPPNAAHSFHQLIRSLGFHLEFVDGKQSELRRHPANESITRYEEAHRYPSWVNGFVWRKRPSAKGIIAHIGNDLRLRAAGRAICDGDYGAMAGFTASRFIWCD